MDLAEYHNIDLMDFVEEDEDICPCCGEHLQAETVNENTDADGNRGRVVHYVWCENCDYEKAF